MRRQGSHHEDPEWIVARRSDIDAVETPRFSRGYWSRTLEYLKILAPDEVVMLPFPNGVPNGLESSIYRAATRKRMRVSVYVRPAAVYICKNGPPDVFSLPRVLSRKRCLVCGAPIYPKAGTGKQFVCAGTRKKKSECQKVLRCSREKGISIEQALQLRRARKQGAAAE